MLLILVVVAVILVVGKLRGGDTGETDPTVINVDPSSSESESAASLEPTDNQEINDLVDAYFTAVAACDMDALSRLLYSTEGITQEQLEAEREYVEGYEDITCYSLDGLIDGTYIVYVSYGMKFINVETPAPSLIRLISAPTTRARCISTIRTWVRTTRWPPTWKRWTPGTTCAP